MSPTDIFQWLVICLLLLLCAESWRAHWRLVAALRKKCAQDDVAYAQLKELVKLL